MEKKEFFYVEQLNIITQHIEDVYVTSSQNLDELLLSLENSDDFAGDSPYVPQVYWITEKQFNKFPYIVLDAEQALVTFAGGVQL